MSLVSLRTKLIALVTLILLAGFVATNALNYEVSKEVLRSTVLEGELPLSSNNIYSAIQTDLLRPVFISSQMANNTFLQNWVLEGELDRQRVSEYLARIRDTYDATTAYFISAKSNRYYHFSNTTRTLSETNPRDAWFYAARDMAEPYAINIDLDQQDNNTYTLFINYRVVDKNGTFLGVTGIGLGLDTVTDLLQRYQTKFNRKIYFADQNGLIQIASDKSISGRVNIRETPGLNKIADQILSQADSSFTYTSIPDNIMLTTRYIPELKWTLFIELPESQASRSIKQGFVRSLLIAPMVISLTILLIAYTINIFQRRLEGMAITDKLTGLYNREYFDLSLAQALQRHKRDQRAVSVLMLDIDHFKDINDQMGHLTGDEVIRRTGEILKEKTRESDLLCRWGGEEFTILAANCRVEDALRLGDTIRAAMHAEAFFLQRPDRHVTVSVGVTQVTPNDTEVDVLARVDEAMYAAKEAGRNCTHVR